MRRAPHPTRAPHGLCTALVLCCAPGVLAEELPLAPGEAATSPPPVVSTLDFEAAGALSFLFAELAVPGTGSLNPVGGGAYVAVRYVPKTFPFHAFFETGGGLFATGVTTGPSGTDYESSLSAWFFSPGVGFDLGALRMTVGVGPALVRTSQTSESERSSSTSLAIASEVGASYRFWEKNAWALSAGLRYQMVPGAKIHALCLGLQVRFGSIAYRAKAE
jgi:hypothetical protein